MTPGQKLTILKTLCKTSAARLKSSFETFELKARACSEDGVIKNLKTLKEDIDEELEILIQLEKEIV